MNSAVQVGKIIRHIFQACIKIMSLFSCGRL